MGVESTGASNSKVCISRDLYGVLGVDGRVLKELSILSQSEMHCSLAFSSFGNAHAVMLRERWCKTLCGFASSFLPSFSFCGCLDGCRNEDQKLWKCGLYMYKTPQKKEEEEEENE
ncbi:hypothetical protein Ancab_008640 [Ancistrocladus abbreviatus]